MVLRLFTRLMGGKKISIVGLDNAGKTTILNFLRYNNGGVTTPTMGVDQEEIKLYDLKLSVWDMGGQKPFRKLWPDYISSSDLLIFVIDLADKKRIKEAKQEFWNAIANLDEGKPVIIFGNKSDLENRLSLEDLIDELDLVKLKDHPWQIFETSGKYGFGLISAFGWIYSKLTGKQIRFNIDIDNIYIFKKGGIPYTSLIIQKDSTDKEAFLPMLTEVLNTYAEQYFNDSGGVQHLTLKNRLIVLHRTENLTGVAIAPLKSDPTAIQEILSRIVHKVEKEYKNNKHELDTQEFHKIYEEVISFN